MTKTILKRIITYYFCFTLSIQHASAVSMAYQRGYEKITFVGSGEATSPTADAVITVPSGTKHGDVMIACTNELTATPNFDIEGFAELVNEAGTNTDLQCGRKVVGTTVPSTITCRGQGGPVSCTVMVFRGVARPTAEDVTTPAAATSGGSTTPDSPSITTVSPEVVIISAVATAAGDSSVTQPTGFNDQVDIADLGRTTAMAHRMLGHTGAYDPPSWTNFTSSEWIASTIALRPRQLELPLPEIVTATCVTDVTDLTTYTFSNITLPGVDDGETVRLVAGIVGEDGTSVFGVNSVTFDGNAATQEVDEDGTGVVNSAIFALTATNAAQVTVAVTWSEAIQAAGVCLWAIRNLTTPGTELETVADDDTASGVLQLSIDGRADAAILGVCINAGVADSATWDADITEVEDTQNAEFDYSNAQQLGRGTNDDTFTADTDCDWSGGNDASGATISYR